MKAGTAVKNKELTKSIDELITHYEMGNIADGKSPSTVRWYNDILRSFCKYRKAKNQSCDILDFNIDTVRDYILYLREKPKFLGHPYTPQQSELVSTNTVRCHIRGFKAFSTSLYLEGYTAENRLKNLKLPKALVTIKEPLTPAEIKAALASIDKNTPTGLRNYSIASTMLDSGLRASEVANIKLGNLNLVDGYAKVMGKGSKERIVPLGKVVQKILWQYINLARPKPAMSDCENLFLSTTGYPITVNTIKLIFSRLAKISGVARLHAHLCRHTFAINYLLNGGDIFSLQEILGHTTLEMVRHYLHFTSSQVAAQHHKYSPMDKLYGEEAKAAGKDASGSAVAK